MNYETRKLDTYNEHLPQTGNVEFDVDSNSISKTRHLKRLVNLRTLSTRPSKQDSSQKLMLASGVSVPATARTGWVAGVPLNNVQDRHSDVLFSKWFLLGAALTAFILLLGS